jgi:putative ABC transport system substrate-binding protein
MEGATLSRRRLLGGGLALAGLGALAGCGFDPSRGLWPARIPRLGVVALKSNEERNLPAFLQGLRDLGYVEGQTIAIESRFADQNAQFGALAAEIVALNPDVILAGVTGAAQAAKGLTGTIPIVMASSANAVEIGLVASLARPGGNVTGMSNDTAGVVSKQFELIKQAVPALVRLAVLWNPSNPANERSLRANEEVVRQLGLELSKFPVESPADLPDAFAGAVGSGAEALMAIAGVQGPQHDPAIVEFARQRRLPSMFPFREPVALGGLMCYASDIDGSFYRSAAFVDKILKSAKPADLPVERNDKFQLVINLPAAQALGLVLPPDVMALASEVIR